MLASVPPSDIENETNMTTNIINQEMTNKAPHTPFEIGEVVDVQSRTWPGINKPGGTARVKSFDVSSQTYCVTYMLGGKEDGIDVEYVKKHFDEGARERRQSTVMNIPAPVTVAKKKKRRIVPSNVLRESGVGDAVKIKKTKNQKKKSTPVTCGNSIEGTISSNNESDKSSSLSSEEEEEEDDDYDDEEEVEYEEYSEEDGEETDVPTPSLSEGTQTALSLIPEAFGACSPNGDGIYLVSDIEEYIMSKGSCSKEDVVSSFVQAEEENRIMVDDGCIYVI